MLGVGSSSLGTASWPFEGGEGSGDRGLVGVLIVSALKLGEPLAGEECSATEGRDLSCREGVVMVFRGVRLAGTLSDLRAGSRRLMSSKFSRDPRIPSMPKLHSASSHRRRSSSRSCADREMRVCGSETEGDVKLTLRLRVSGGDKEPAEEVLETEGSC
jgi:hypothetical protein